MKNARTAVFVACVMATMPLSGCGGSGAEPAPHAGVLSEMIAQVKSVNDRTFTAVYRFGDNKSATVAHLAEPERTAYEFPAGSQVVTEAFVMTCRGTEPSDCRAVDAESQASGLDAELLADIDGTGFVTVATVASFLSTAATDTGASIEPDGSTIAGERATCVAVNGVTSSAVSASFDACITDSGLLGSFEGTVGGEKISIVLGTFSGEVDQTRFDVPAEAVDERSG